MAIRESKIYIYEKPELPFTKTPIYLDIEGYSDNEFCYLIGIIIIDNGIEKRHSFWAENIDKEKFILKQLFKILSNYPDYSLFHFGNYEIKFFKRMRTQFNGEHDQALDNILNRSINVLSILYANIYFPTYSNGLKDLAKYLGFKWSIVDASGIQSLVWRRKWELTKDGALKQKLITYNFDDCSALQKITEFIKLLNSNYSRENNNEMSKFVFIDSLKRVGKYKFGRNDFFYPELKQINECAYFDYQRQKIFIRTNQSLKKAQSCYSKKDKRVQKIDKRILLTAPKQCPTCKHKRLHRYDRRSRIVRDLKFSDKGVKRWIVTYYTHRFRCLKCRNVFTPDNFKQINKYGHALLSWIIYNHVALVQPFTKIDKNINDLFNLPFGGTSSYKFKQYAAKYYQQTLEKLISKLIQSSILHIDETTVKIKGIQEYVWIFSNMEEVVFLHTKTRQGDFLKEMLQNFHGILISDFYAAYDSIECLQQKCLIHLIRDLNENLFKNPFDKEFKEIVLKFSVLLKDIVSTIDRYGLKRRYLNKHNKTKEKFLKEILRPQYQSELAGSFQKRFRKNKDKLFTFLNYDGIPWNNNNAEHAIKHFATYRKIANGTFTELGISQYLKLLSIQQTCNYKNINFLKFLLSGEKDIDSYKTR